VVRPPHAIARRTDALTVAYFVVIVLSLGCLLVAQGHFLQSARVRDAFKRMDLQG
jgi:hypothetical protein